MRAAANRSQPHGYLLPIPCVATRSKMSGSQCTTPPACTACPPVRLALHTGSQHGRRIRQAQLHGLLTPPTPPPLLRSAALLSIHAKVMMNLGTRAPARHGCCGGAHCAHSWAHTRPSPPPPSHTAALPAQRPCHPPCLRAQAPATTAQTPRAARCSGGRALGSTVLDSLLTDRIGIR